MGGGGGWVGDPIAGCKDWKTSTSASPLSSIRAASCRQYFFSCVLAFIYDRISSTCAYNLPEPPWTNHIFRHLEQLPWSIHPSVTFSDFYCVIAKLSGSQIKSWVALSLLVVRPSVPHPLHEHLCQYIWILSIDASIYNIYDAYLVVSGPGGVWWCLEHVWWFLVVSGGVWCMSGGVWWCQCI